MSRNALAIFVKTPGLSPLKTRLAAEIGEDKALEFYRLCIASIENTVRNSDVKAYWAIGEEAGMNDPLWNGLERLHTGHGDLGQRQHHVYSNLLETHQNVALIGADCPQICPHTIQSAFSLMQDHSFVVGPAKDGGYYLFAGKKPLPLKSWTNVTYSQNYTRKQLINNLPNTPIMLQELSDIDHKRDLYTALKQMPNTASAQQENIIQWIKKIA